MRTAHSNKTCASRLLASFGCCRASLAKRSFACCPSLAVSRAQLSRTVALLLENHLRRLCTACIFPLAFPLALAGWYNSGTWFDAMLCPFDARHESVMPRVKGLFRRRFVVDMDGVSPSVVHSTRRLLGRCLKRVQATDDHECWPPLVRDSQLGTGLFRADPPRERRQR